MAELQSYFTRRGQIRALEAYGSFARGSAWSVPLKMDLYDYSHAAFVARDDGLPCFQRIYESLASYWQVFRPQGRKRCWTAERIFSSLIETFGPWSQRTEVRLRLFDHKAATVTLRSALEALRGIKPGAQYPTMTVSKFLHFFNPRLFPIYDTQVVENRVLRCFWDNYASFCDEHGCNKRATGADFLLNYLGWGMATLASADEGFMPRFVEWLETELPPKQFKERLMLLDATAFEFTLIGAAVVESPSDEEDLCPL